MLGYFSAINSIIADSSNIILTKQFVRRLGEVRLSIIGTISGAVSLILLGVSTEDWMVALGKNVSQ